LELVEVYKCLCDETRLRILHLLTRGPLCVCHFQALLDAPQVKVSKHLGYLRKRGMVEARKLGAWVIYSLPTRPAPELAANLKCLQDCCRELPVFAADLRRLATVKCGMTGSIQPDTCEPSRS
jgi:ArsR family transcriptional regulator